MNIPRRFVPKGFSLFVIAILITSVCFEAFAAAEEDAVELKVEKGDRLIRLCGRYLADPEKWREIAKFNRLKNPDIIQPGQTIRIPVRLMPGVPLEGKVAFVHGDARIQKDEKGKWVPLQLEEKVFQGSKVQTGKASSLELTFEDRNKIFLKPETTLGIITSEKKGSTYSVNNLYINTGRAITKVQEATGSDSRIRIYTPSAVASVRGTRFRVSVDDKAFMRTEVLTGIVGVSAMNKTVQLHQGEGTYVQKGSAPASPKRLLPPPKPIGLKSIYKDMPLRFAFDAGPGLSSIRGTFADDKDGKNILDEKVIKPNDFLEFVAPSDGTYYLFSQGIDELGIEGFESDAHEIRVRVNPLPPLIQSKGEETEFIGKSAEFTWLKVKDAVLYHVQVAKDGAFTDIIERKQDHKSQDYKTGEFDYGTYYLRVCSVADDNYEGGWSDPIPFRLIPPPPSPPLEKPAVGEKEILLKWRNIGEGITYHFQMAKDPGFNEVLLDKKLDKPAITLQKPEEPGIYHVRTSSIDKKGREGNFSSPQSFEIEKKGCPCGILGLFGVVAGLSLLLIP